MSNSINLIIKVFSSNSASFIINFIIGVFIARFLGAEGKGIYASILLVPGILLTLGELGIRQSLVYYLGRKLIPTNNIIATGYSFVFYLSIILVFITYLVFNTYYKGEFSSLAQLLALITIPITLFTKISSGILLGKGEVGFFNKLNWIPTTLNLILIIIFCFLFNLYIAGALLALILARSSISAYGFLHIYKTNKFNLFTDFKWETFYKLFSKGILYAISLFIIQLNYKIDIFLLKEFVDFEQIGYYSVGVSLAEIIWQIPTAIGIVILSKTATSFNNSQKYNVSKAFRVSLVLSALVALFFIIFMRLFIVFVYGEDFIQSVPVNKIILLGVISFTSFKIFNSRFAGMGKPIIAIKIFIPALALKVLFNYLLIPQYGIIGAAWATNISYLFAGLAMIVAFSKVENIPIIEIIRFKKDDFTEIIQLIKKILKPIGK